MSNDLLETSIAKIEKCIKAFELTRKSGSLSQDQEIRFRSELSFLLCILERKACSKTDKKLGQGCPWAKCLGLLSSLGWKESFGREPEGIMDGFRRSVA